MRRVFFIILVLLLSKPLLAQEGEERFYFYVTIENPVGLDFTENGDGTLSLIADTESLETEIYNSYKIFEFERAFGGTRKDNLLKVYRIATNSVELISRLWHNFPEKYSKVDQFYPDETAFYPNDYGGTSPVENLGTGHPLYDLDLVNAAKAWGITAGSDKVIIGISDSRIDSTNAEFLNRISYLSYIDAKEGIQCSHGSNVAALAAATANNGYGRPGICSNCSIIGHGYGNFKYIEELVASGARVINASWAQCSMGKYHKEIEERINELYEDGILIVAGAGNAKNCNRNDDYAPDDYAYPASYEKVISVTGVFSRFDSPLDSTFVDDKGWKSARNVKDLHAAEVAITGSGKIVSKFQKLVMQFNESIDLCAPAKSYLLGNELCGNDVVFGGATSSTAPYVTGTIGLMWSVNYCLDAYETESILKLTSAPIDHLPGNEPFAGKLGAGRLNTYGAVKMARDMKEIMGTVEISGRNFNRFHFRLRNSPYNISVSNQTFRDSSSVDFTARNQIVLKPNTRLAPDSNGYVHLRTDPGTDLKECFPKPPKQYESIYPESEKPGSNRLFNFGVAYDKSRKRLNIEVKSSTYLRQRNVPYKVRIIAHNNTLIKEMSYNLPDDASMEVDLSNHSTVNVLLLVGSRKEYHKIKIE